MAKTITSSSTLNTLLPDWYALLQGWAKDGSLITAAEEVFLLTASKGSTKSSEASTIGLENRSGKATGSSSRRNQTTGILQGLNAQLKAGNFQNLPEIIILSSANMNWAPGAYAESTNTIFLNEELVTGGDIDAVYAVLTEEFGEYLSATLNPEGTPGDAGEYFLRLINGELISVEEANSLREQDDSGFITTQNGAVSVQFAAGSTNYQSPSVGTQPNNAKTWQNDPTVIQNATTGGALTGTITGTNGDDIYRGNPGDYYQTGNGVISNLTVNDLSGSSFVYSEGSLPIPYAGGPTYSIIGSKFTFGDQYVSISSTVKTGNYAFGLANSTVSMGAGNSDINVIIEDAAYYSSQGIYYSTISAGAGIDVVNVNLGYSGDSNWGIRGSNFYMGDGDDVVSSQSYAISYIPSWISHAVLDSSIDMGNGADIVDFHSTYFYAISNTIVNMGAGNDKALIYGVSKGSTIDFGADYDELRIYGSSLDYIWTPTSNDGDFIITKKNNTEYNLNALNLEKIVFDDISVVTLINSGNARFRINGNGTGQQTQVLTCTIDQLDPDGMTKYPPSSNGYTYQWQSSSDGKTWANIANANSFQYSVQQATDANKFLRVQVGYTDDKYFFATVTTEQVKIIFGTASNEKFQGTSGIDVTFSGTGIDTISTGLGNDFAKGEVGNDTFTCKDGDGNDFFDGGSEVDTVDYFGSKKGVTIDFMTGIATERATGGTGKDTFANIENARGTSVADTFTGNEFVNTFIGAGGADTFKFLNAQTFGAATSDRITDISSDDKIQVSKLAFGLTQNYSYAAVSGITAVNASSALVIYDTNSGYVYLNKDGMTNGLGGGGVFCVLDNKFATLSANQISLV